MIKEFYDEFETLWSYERGPFTAYLRTPKKGKYILHGHVNGTPREEDQTVVIPKTSLAWAIKAALYFLNGGILPLTVDAELSVNDLARPE